MKRTKRTVDLILKLNNILRMELQGKPNFNERSFQRMLKAFDERQKVTAVKEARAILGLGLRQSLDFVNKYW